MEKTRQRLADGLAEMPPGPRLAAVLTTIDLTRLGGADCVEVLRAQHRQAAHEQARLMTAMVEVALCGVGPDDALPRMDAPDEFSADEIRGALCWTRSTAGGQLSLAWDLINRLPQVFAALEAGAIDVPKTKVFSEWTWGLTDEQAHTICDQLLTEAPRLTTGQLIDRIKKLAIAIDSDWARRRYAEAVRDRKVIGYRNDDGSANVSGQNLPADRAAAACGHIDALARKAKRAGDCRPSNHIRADLFVGMLDGSYTGWSETAIIDHLLTMADPEPADGSHEPARDGGCEDRRDDHGDLGHDLGVSGAGKIEGSEPDDTRQHDACPVPPPTRRVGIEIRAEITTLLGLDDHPGEIAGWGPVHADVARRLVRDQTAAEWRFAITDEHGRLWHEGITRMRVTGYPARADAPCRGGIVELQVKLSTLRRLASGHTRPEDHKGWAKIIADLARQADQLQHGGATLDKHQRQRGRGGRSPGRPLRRRTQIRDRTCIHPQCRAPAYNTDGDHTQDWAVGGATHEGNIGSACRHDHRLKHDGGWIVIQSKPGHFVWISRLGRHYHVRPPLIIPLLPDPIPRDPPPAIPQNDHEVEDGPTWQEPANSEPPPRPPAPGPPDDPPF
jgi:hypothetical protein